MAKALRTAAIVVSAVALTIGTAGALAPVATASALSAIGVTAAVSTIVAVASAAAAVLSIGAQLLTKQPGTTISGNQTQFTASLTQGLPWAMGRTGTAGCAVHDITYDAAGSSNNAYQTFFGVWSADRIDGVETNLINSVPVNFSGGAAVGGYANWMWLNTQLGLDPEPAALTAIPAQPYPPGWSAASKLSGMGAFGWTMKFDTSGATYPGGVVPQKLDVIRGAWAWDPRKDDTYPGGSGSQRPDDPTTWAYTENPFLLGLRWLRGIWHNGIKVLGIGAALSAIDVPSAVYGANIADANGWKAGGVVYSTDPKNDVLTKILAAGSGESIRVGGKWYFVVNAPRASMATITTGDLIGKATAPSGPSLLDRINGVIPTCRIESQNWQLVPCAKVSVPEFVAADGRPVTSPQTWELVQDAAQVAQLATYYICNSREIDGIVMPLKIQWIGYKPGDAVTIASSVMAMDSQLVVLRKRQIDPATGAVTFTVRTETTSKHPFALGQTTSPPPTPALATNDRTGLLMPGVDAAWTGVRDDDPNNHPKPADGATNSADPSSPLGASTVGEALTAIANARDDVDELQATAAGLRDDADAMILAALQSQLLSDALQARLDALALVDGKKIKLVLRQSITDQQDGDARLYEILNLIGLVNEDGSAFIIDLDKVKVGPDESFASHLDELTAELQGAIDTKASIDQMTEATAGEHDARVKALSELETELQGDIDTKASITDLEEAMSGEHDSRADAISTLKTELQGDIDTKASITDVEEAVSGEHDSSADAISTLKTELQGDIDTKASITDLATAVSGEHDARVAAMSVLQTDLQGDIDSKASVSDLETAISTEHDARARAVQDIQAGIDGLTGTVSDLSEVVAEQGGKLTARFEQVADVGGGQAGIIGTVEMSDGTTTSNLALVADSTGIFVKSPDGTYHQVASFTVDGLQVFGKLQVNAVDTPNLMDGAISSAEPYSDNAAGTVIGIGTQANGVVVPSAYTTGYFAFTGTGARTKVEIQFSLVNSYAPGGGIDAAIATIGIYRAGTGGAADVRLIEFEAHAGWAGPISIFGLDMPAPAGANHYYAKIVITGPGGNSSGWTVGPVFAFIEETKK